MGTIITTDNNSGVHMTIKRKLIISFVAIAIAVVGLVSFSTNGIRKSNDDFSSYREMAKDAFLASRVQTNMLMVRMNVKDYLNTASQKDIKEFEDYYKKTTGSMNKALKEIQKPSRASMVKVMAKDLKVYKNSFYDVVKYMKERNDIVNNNLDVNGKKIEKLLTSVMQSARKDGDESSALDTAAGIRTLLLARLYTAKYLASSSLKDAQRVDKEFASLSKELARIRSNLENETRRKNLQNTVGLIETYKNGVKKIVTIIQKRNEIIDNKLNTIGPKIAKLAEDVKLSVKKDQNIIGKQVKEDNDRLEKLLLITSIGILIFIIFLSFYSITKFIVKPLSLLEDITKDLAEGEGDLTKRLKIAGKDEITVIAENINNFIEKVQTTISEAKSSSSENSSIAEELSQTSLQIGKKAEEESSIVAGAAKKGKDLEDVLNSSITEAKETKQEIIETGKKLENAKTKIASLSQGVHESSIAEIEMATKLQQLSADTEQVKGVLTVIAEVADQTNLLALNAAIEAARAGEHGRGFAVVADEVRQLAERTQKSLAEINATINVVVQAISDATEQITHNAKKAKALAETSSDVEQEIDQSVDTVQESIADIENIINGYVQNADIAKTIITEIEKVNHLSSDNARSVEEIASAADHMSQMAVKLTDLLNQYKA